jgi:hypothetical protein
MTGIDLTNAFPGMDLVLRDLANMGYVGCYQQAAPVSCACEKRHDATGGTKFMSPPSPVALLGPWLETFHAPLHSQPRSRMAS